MKLSIISLLAALSLVGAGQGLAQPSHHVALKTLTVVMHDPGCHWFSIGGKFTTSASVTGPIRVANFDMTTLKVASRHGLQRILVGKSIVVSRGNYVITMVGQAVDDNHLKLAVH